MNGNVITMLENMASYGTAPEEGCSLFGVGYEDAFRRLKTTYLLNRFDRGSSAEKFIVGPFGSGKTHFLHQLLEIARSVNCATVKVTLNKDIDFTQSMVVFKEIAREIRVPGQEGHGITALIQASLTSIGGKAPNSEVSRVLMQGWINGLEQADFKLPAYGRALKTACLSIVDGDRERFEAACRWLGGDMEDRPLCGILGIAPLQKGESNLYAKRAMMSLFRFVKIAGYRGTVVGYDEAEQGFAVDKKKTEKILSMLMAGINATVELDKGSVLLVYALTPDLMEKMDSFAALQQRISDPGPNLGFFDGNVYAPVIDLTKRTDMVQDLNSIGAKLVELLYEHHEAEIAAPKDDILQQVARLAVAVSEEDISSSNRRTMVKRVCTILLRLYDEAYAEHAATAENEEEV